MIAVASNDEEQRTRESLATEVRLGLINYHAVLIVYKLSVHVARNEAKGTLAIGNAQSAAVRRCTACYSDSLGYTSVRDLSR